MTGSSVVDVHIFFFLCSFHPLLQINQATHDQALVLQSALQNIPNPASECMLRNVAIRLAQQISDEVTENVRKPFIREYLENLNFQSKYMLSWSLTLVFWDFFSL